MASRQRVATAAIAIAAQSPMSVADAVSRLRGLAFATNRRLVDVAADVMAGAFFDIS
nr:hypothetical protein [Williamsia serinedens]